MAVAVCNLLENYFLDSQGLEKTVIFIHPLTLSPQVTSVVAKITIVPWEKELITMVTMKVASFQGTFLKAWISTWVDTPSYFIQ